MVMNRCVGVLHISNDPDVCINTSKEFVVGQTQIYRLHRLITGNNDVNN